MEPPELPLGAMEPPEEGPPFVAQPLKAKSSAAQNRKQKYCFINSVGFLTFT